MNTYTQDNIQTAIEMQYSLAELYHYLSGEFPVDRLFWNQLETEENKQAEKLESALQLVEGQSELEESKALDSNAYHKTIKEIDDSIEKGLLNNNRSGAFGFAHKLEKLSEELHFHQGHSSSIPHEVSDIFLSLNAIEAEHSNRIMDYWRGIRTSV